MKIEFKWENIGSFEDSTWRAKVIGGWLILREDHICFIPDEKHLWEIKRSTQNSGIVMALNEWSRKSKKYKAKYMDGFFKLYGDKTNGKDARKEIDQNTNRRSRTDHVSHMANKRKDQILCYSKWGQKKSQGSRQI